MKKFLLTLAALPAATMALEASAQPGMNGGMGIQNRIAMLETRLDAGVQARTIDRNEARNLRQQIRQLRQLEMQYSANGLTQQERSALQQRLRSVREQLRTAYGQGYSWNDSDWDSGYGSAGVTYDQYGRAIPNNGVTYDQYGRPVASSAYGQGGPYEAPRSNGIGGVIGGLLGNGGLNVGDLITGAMGSRLGAVPSTYGSQYQNRSNVYFRSDGQRVYEIDARTNTVVRVHPLQR